MTELASLETRFLAHLGRKISTLGFDPAQKGSWFVRPTPAGRVGINLAVERFAYEAPPYFDCFVSVGVRVDAVEGVLNLARPWLSKNECSKTWTIGLPFFSMTKDFPFKIEIRTEADFSQSSSLISDAWQDCGVQLAERFSSVELAYAEFKDGEPHVYTGGVTQTAQAAIAACYALGPSRSEFSALVERKKEEIKDHPNGSISMLDDLVSAIEGASVGYTMVGRRRNRGRVSMSSNAGVEWGRDVGPRSTKRVVVDVDPATGEATISDDELRKLGKH